MKASSRSAFEDRDRRARGLGAVVGRLLAREERLVVGGRREPAAAGRVAEERLRPLGQVERRREPARLEGRLVEVEEAGGEEGVVVEERRDRRRRRPTSVRCSRPSFTIAAEDELGGAAPRRRRNAARRATRPPKASAEMASPFQPASTFSSRSGGGRRVARRA